MLVFAPFWVLGRSETAQSWANQAFASFECADSGHGPIKALRANLLGSLLGFSVHRKAWPDSLASPLFWGLGQGAGSWGRDRIRRMARLCDWLAIRIAQCAG